MSGQSATLSISEAKAMQKRIECRGSEHQGPNNPNATAELCKKTPHQGGESNMKKGMGSK
jgi:hypothetical protein